MSEFDEWLLDRGYIQSIDTIQSDLSAVELDILYGIWEISK